MKLGERNFIFNFQKLNKDNPLTFYTFKKPKGIKRYMSLMLHSWLGVIIISLSALGIKLVAEDLSAFIFSLFH